MSDQSSSEYTPVQPDILRAIANSHGKDIVILIAWDASSNKTNTASWGRSADYKAAASSGADKCAKALGLDPSKAEVHTDYATKEIGELTAKIEQANDERNALREENRKLRFMVENGLGPEDMGDDIEWPR